MNLTEHRERVEQAQRILAEGRKALLRPDGSRTFSDTEHVEREAALLAQFSATIREAGEVAQAAANEAEAELTRPETDPLSGLSTAELERVNLLLPIAERDAELLSLPELAGRMELALDAGKAERYTWWRVSDRLVRQWRNGARSGIAPTDTAGRRAVATIDTLHGRLLGSLVDVEKRRRAEQHAEERRRAAWSVGNAAAVTRYLQETYGPRPATVNGG